MIETAELLSLFHLLVILVKAVVSVLNDEGVHHSHGGGCTKVISLGITTFANSLCGGS